MLTSDPHSPTLSLDHYPHFWQMTRCEKYAFHNLLEHIEPEVAIEIGSYKGGSLQVISEFSDKVYSIDITDKHRHEYRDSFTNVSCHTGDSRKLIPEVLATIEEKGESLEFVLIDGDHTEEGVKNDINEVLKYKPKKRLYVLFHDTFIPMARKGILGADWEKNPNVHYVEIDFVPGVFHEKMKGSNRKNVIAGGLCLAIIEPHPRDFELQIHQSQKKLFELMYRKSIYAPHRWFLYRLKNFLRLK